MPVRTLPSSQQELEQLLKASIGGPGVAVAYRKAVQTLKATVFEKVQLDTVIEDPEKLIDTTNGWYVVPRTGNYLCCGNIEASAVIGSVDAAIYLSGTQELLGGFFEFGAANNMSGSVVIGIIHASAGQHIELRGRLNGEHTLEANNKAVNRLSVMPCTPPQGQQGPPGPKGEKGENGVVTQAEVEEKLKSFLLNGPLYFPEVAAAELTENPTKNLTLPEATTVLLKSSINNLKLESIVAPAKGGRLVQLVNNTTNAIILLNNPAQPNGIITWGGLIGEYVIKVKQSVWLYYDTALKTWLTVPSPPPVQPAAVGVNGTITVGSPGIPRGNTAVIVGDGVTLTWKVKHLLGSQRQIVQFAEGATQSIPIASPFAGKEEYKVTEDVFETAVALEAGKVILVKMLAIA